MVLISFQPGCSETTTQVQTTRCSNTDPWILTFFFDTNTLYIVIQYYHFSLCRSNWPSFWPLEAFPGECCVLATHFPPPFLLSSTTRCSRLTLGFLCPKPRIFHLSRNLDSFLNWRVRFRSRDLGTMCPSYQWGVTASPTTHRPRECIHIY